MGYAHLARKERYYIYQAVKSGTSFRTIAKRMGRNGSTVSRELARNTGARGYRYRQAEKRSQKRQANKGKKRICPETWAYVEQCLRKDFSPEQISGVLTRKGFALSHEWIYQYVMADKKRDGTLHSHLRCQRKRKRRYGKPDKRGQIKGRISIDTRPTIVAERTRLGDWEADTVEGSKGDPILVILAERKSRLFLVGKSPNKSASEVRRVIERLLTPIKASPQCSILTLMRLHSTMFDWRGHGGSCRPRKTLAYNLIFSPHLCPPKYPLPQATVNLFLWLGKAVPTMVKSVRLYAPTCTRTGYNNGEHSDHIDHRIYQFFQQNKKFCIIYFLLNPLILPP